MKKIKLSLQTLLLIIALQFLLMSCANYYKAVSTPIKNNAVKAAKLDSLNHANRTLILRNGTNAFYLKNPVLNADQNKIECSLERLSLINKLHLSKGRNGNLRYKKNNPTDLSVLNEVHVYVEPDDKIVLGGNSISLDKIQKIEVIEKDKSRTIGSYILGGLGIATGIALITGIIFAATFSFDLGGGWGG